MKLLILPALITSLLLCGYTPHATAAVGDDIQTLMARGDYQAALAYINTELEKNTLDEGLLLAKGFALTRLNRLDEAVAFYQKLRTVLKNNPEPGNNLGVVYRQKQDYLSAIRAFGETIRDFPNYTPAHINLGDTYIELAQARYQKGFETTGNVTLQQKAALASNFGELARQALENNARRIAEQGLLSPPVAPQPTKQPEVSEQAGFAPPIQEILSELEAWAEVVWQRTAEIGGTLIGMKFTHLNEKDRRALVELLRDQPLAG